MIIIKGNDCFCDANRIVSAFVSTSEFRARTRVYFLQVNLQGLTLPQGFTLARFSYKADAQEALDTLASFIGCGLDSDTPDKILDLNHVGNKEDK